jgi:hypothetical protein
VAFDYEPGLLHGFIDVVDGATATVLPGDSNGDGILDGDGFADDVDADGQYGPHGYDLDDPAGVPDTLLAIDTNFEGNPPGTTYNQWDPDDLVELPTSFNSMVVRNAATLNGVELMRIHRIDNRNWMAKHSTYNSLDLSYGVRYLRFRDNFFVGASGGVLGLSQWDTQIINNIVGPQVGLKWSNQRGRWTTNLAGRFIFGYNVSNWDQDGFMGFDLVPGVSTGLIPGRLNRPLYLNAKSFKYARQDNDFSPVAELRWDAAYRVTKSVAIDVGLTAGYVGNIYRASTHVHYRLPDMGFLVGNPEHMLYYGGNMGVQFNF